MLPGGSPNLKYYRPLEAPQEQYLLLYTNRFAPGDRPNEVPSYADLYALAPSNSRKNASSSSCAKHSMPPKRPAASAGALMGIPNRCRY